MMSWAQARPSSGAQVVYMTDNISVLSYLWEKKAGGVRFYLKSKSQRLNLAREMKLFQELWAGKMD